jgi:hypothetical protein
VQVKGLAALCKEKPADPVRWLAVWLLTNNPAKPAVLRADGTIVDVASVRIHMVLRYAHSLPYGCSIGVGPSTEDFGALSSIARPT